ncbi:VCBS repeat-containing protein [bacterium]|nr:VCBS repeat-containing protein [bacterium]
MIRRWLMLGVVLLGGRVAAGQAADARAAAGQSLFRKHVIDAALPAIAADAADVNGDGRLDVIAAGGPGGWHSEWANLLYWYEAPGWTKRLIDRLRTNSVILHLEAVDFTSRTAISRTPGTASLPVKPTGGSHSRATVPLARSPEFTVTEGIYGDIWWYRYDRHAKAWRGSVIVPDIKFAHGTAAADIDRDGLMDVLVPTQRTKPNTGLIFARNPGSAAARAKPWPTSSVDDDLLLGNAHYARLVDLNGDGRLDALHAASHENKQGWFGYWLQGADPFQTWDRHKLTGPMEQATNLDAADLNGDGLVDLVGTEGHGTGVWWFPAPEYQAVRVDDTLKSTHSLALGDYDGNGAIDIFTCGYESKKVACFLNDGKGNFRMVIVDPNQQAYDAKAVDLDGDGDLDILLSGQFSGNLVWYENRQAGP